MNFDKKIEEFNKGIMELASHLPVSSPIKAIQFIKLDKIVANDYNPNAVAPPEMKLLKLSIMDDGYTQPVVVVYDKENDIYVIVDGFHRYRTMKENKDVYEIMNGYLPCVILEKSISDRMASTIRHNRARGSHDVELMSNMVKELVEIGRSDEWIMKKLGMDKEELLRLKQITGLESLFKDKEFSEAWEVVE
jgi:ParB-like chromosome segregation protein Spo0J